MSGIAHDSNGDSKPMSAPIPAFPHSHIERDARGVYTLRIDDAKSLNILASPVTLGLTAAIITMFAGVMISYVIVKMDVKGKGILEFLGMLPFSVPGSVIALGVILAWSGQFGVNLYNTVWIILVAYIARYMAFSLKANSAALEQVHDSLVEASRACGATMWQSLKDIVLPLVKPGMFAAFFLIFLPSLRELTVSIMLYAPTTRTIGVAIYTLNEDGETVISCALAAIALIIIIVGQTVINHFTKKESE